MSEKESVQMGKKQFVCVGEFACSYAKTVAVNILQQHISQNYNRTSFTKW